MFVYLDNGSTTKQDESVIEKMLRYMENDFGNPSSLHGMGLTAEKAVKEARHEVAAAVGFSDEEVYFTSGGTEAANMAIFGAAMARKKRGNKIITSKVEHPAVYESCKKLEQMGFEVVYIGVDDKCRLNMEELRSHIDEKTILISVMTVNNEVGTVMPINEILEAKKLGGMKNTDVIFHTDAVQSLGKIPVGSNACQTRNADIVTVSSHKIHGPKGVGAIAVRKGITLEQLVFGGGQEKNLRSGTENVAGIAGFGEAAKIVTEHLMGRAVLVAKARSYLLNGIKAEIKDIKINSFEEANIAGESGYCSPAILNISFLGTRGEVILHGLESENIYVSTGAACSSNKKSKNRTLTAMGLSDKEIEGTLRFSLSVFNSEKQMDYVLVKLKEQVERFRKLGSFR